MKQDRESDIIQLGADAYHLNKPLSCNPYAHDTSLKVLKDKWELGWMLAADYELSSVEHTHH